MSIAQLEYSIALGWWAVDFASPVQLINETLLLIHESIISKGKMRDKKCSQYKSIKPVEQKGH